MASKYLVMSLDDGTTQDEKVISVLRKYNLTATFNINSGRLGEKEEIPVPAYNGKPLLHDKVTAEDIKGGLYNGFEVACHGLTHAKLNETDDGELKKEIFEDYDNISSLTGIKSCGIAYPGALPNYNERVINTLKKSGKLFYGRTIEETHGFSFPADFLRWNPTCQFRGDELLLRAEEFFDMKPEKDALFFVWGHSYEFDLGLECWDKLEYFCGEIEKRKDIICLTCSDFYNRFKQK